LTSPRPTAAASPCSSPRGSAACTSSVVPGPEQALHELAPDRLAHPDDPHLAGLALGDLIAAG
jgi:hypothetical protein